MAAQRQARIWQSVFEAPAVLIGPPFKHKSQN
jgi:hypothetical protein